VVALFVGTAVLDSNSGPSPVIAASAVPMTTSASQYQKATFSAQVAEALPRWRSAAAQQATAGPVSTGSESDATGAAPNMTPGPDAVTSAPTPDGLPTTPVSPGASDLPSPSATITFLPANSGLREQVAGCLSQISDQVPMHVEIASYQAGPNMPPEPVAVAAVDGSNSSVEVFAIRVSCVDRDPLLVREHITIHTR
jgi:hypothetical protein